jgi:UPF0755 protein
MQPKRSSSKTKWPVILTIVLAMIVVVAIGGAFVVRRAYDQNLKPLSSSQSSQLIKVEQNATVNQVAGQLQDAGLIRAAWTFEWYFRNQGLNDDLKAGTYSLRPSLSVPEVAAILTDGKIATDLVTILPAQRLDQVRTSLIEKYGFSETAVDAALKPESYANHPALTDKPAGANLEGYLYPESFLKTADTNPETIIRASLDQMQLALTPDLRAGIVRQGLTVHQGVILASIIEREVGNPDDRRVVSQVFLRRLREGRRLESDPTAKYGAALAGQPQSVFYESAYNTYTHNGLPPTPISNVSVSSLQAVANPATTNYLYFVAGDDGKTYFSSTLAEHEALTEQHCKQLCSQ